MNVRIFLVHAMECICAQIRPQFILSSKRVVFFLGGGGGGWSQNPCLLWGKNPLYRKHSPQRRIKPTTIPLRYSGTDIKFIGLYLVWTIGMAIARNNCCLRISIKSCRHNSWSYWDHCHRVVFLGCFFFLICRVRTGVAAPPKRPKLPVLEKKLCELLYIP